jgi:signal transduction histidine kinase
MTKTLYAKLALVLLGLLSVIALLYLFLAFYTTGMYTLEAKQRLHKDLARNLVAGNVLMIDGEINQGALEGIFHNLMVINPDIEVYLLDPEGGILAYSAPPGKVKRARVSLEEVDAFIEETGQFPILGDDPRDLGRKKIFSVHPIGTEAPRGGEGGEGPEGYLYIILGGEEYDSVLGLLKASYIMRLSTWAIGGLLFFGLAAGLVIFRLLTKRLRRLALEMDRFKESDFTFPAELRKSMEGLHAAGGALYGDEIDRLGRTFYGMSERIAGQVKRLKEADNLRRELVANVSHDLRTPLASMQGYIETLLIKEGRMSDEERRRYLETVASHGKRLGKLVTELFELSKLNARETEPNRETFSLGELVQDVCQKLRFSVEGKGIGLKAEFPRDMPFVYADIGLIERVLENLLDNARRFTPEGGAITVRLAPAEGGVTVRVEDTGEGIPEEELAHIFDRFYRAHGSVSKGKGGTGLGLAIAKRILELHGSSIEVESTPGKGTVFSFSLPRSSP